LEYALRIYERDNYRVNNSGRVCIMVETIAHHELTMILIYYRLLKKSFYPTTTTRLRNLSVRYRGEDHGRGHVVE
jgi:hypothetical protein